MLNNKSHLLVKNFKLFYEEYHIIQIKKLIMMSLSTLFCLKNLIIFQLLDLNLTKTKFLIIFRIKWKNFQ